MLTITKSMWSLISDEDADFINRIKKRLTLLSADGQNLITLYMNVENSSTSLYVQSGCVDDLILPYFHFNNIIDQRKIIDIDVKETMKKVKQVYDEMALASPGFEVREHQLMGTLKCLINKHGICEAATGCFVGDTLILTNTGFETLSSLSTCFNGKSVFCSDGKFHNIISAHLSKYVKDTLKIKFNDGVVVECTPDHLFLLSNGKYVEAINLLAESPVAGVYGSRIVEQVFAEHYVEPIPVYDIEVDCDLHNFALSNGVIVHNSGKTEIIASLFKLIDGKILVINNRTNILNQIEGRARLRGVDRKIEYLNRNPVLDNSDIIVSTNNLVWNMVKRQDPKIMRYLKSVRAIIVDECFIGSTKVLTEFGEKQIKDIVEGERVWTFNELTSCYELNSVEKLIEKPLVKNLVKVSTKTKSFVCTEDHKIFTKNGWKEAKYLTNDDYLCEVSDGIKIRQHALFNVWKINITSNKATEGLFTKIRSYLLLSRMFKKEIGTSGKHKYDENKFASSEYYFEEDERTKPDVKRRSSGKSKQYIKSYELETKSSWWKWLWANCSSTNVAKRIRWFCSRVCNKNGFFTKRQFRLSNVLQSRFGERKAENCHRSRWFFTLFFKGSRTGCKERKVFNFNRVESVEIQKCGDSKQCARLCPESKVYDLTVQNNHNYFVEGYLVHNCHHGSCQSIAIPAMIANPEYLIGFTASPFKEGGQCVDDIVLKALFGNSFYYISSKYLRDKGYSSLVYSYYINYAPKAHVFCRGCTDVYKKYVAENFNRNEAAYRCIDFCYRNNLKILVMVSRIEHGKAILREMEDRGIKALFMCGGNTIYEATNATEKTKKGMVQHVVVERKGNAETIKKAIREEGYRVIVGNVVFNEGIDVPEFDVGILMDAGKNIISHVQRIGRVTRRKDKGLNCSVFVDFNDKGHPYLESWVRERKKHLADEGIPEINEDQFKLLIQKMGASKLG